jgi:transcriptional regulator with XRE-family HTH domain
METNEEQVSRNIKSVRQKRGLTQEEIAKNMSISKPTYIQIENNPFKQSITKLIELSDVLDCSIDEFFLEQNITKSEM